MPSYNLTPRQAAFNQFCLYLAIITVALVILFGVMQLTKPEWW